MKILKSLLLTACIAVSLGAQATTINFSSYSGPLASVGDAHFSLAGEGEQGTPSVTSLFTGNDGYLFNSIDGPRYPTNSILAITFDEDVTGVHFVFNTFGNKPTTAWSLFDANHVLISTGQLLGFHGTSNGDFSYDLSQFSNVRSIEYSNGGNDWYQGVASLEYTAEVPEPGVLSLLGLGIGGLLLARRRSAA